MPFELIPLEESSQPYFSDRRWPTNPNQPHCPCGRFAKFLGMRHVYNGNHTVEVQTTSCRRCGVQEARLT